MENTLNHIKQKDNDTLTLEFIIHFFRSNLSLMTVYMYFIGISYILFYYFLWGIDITKYISISETLLFPIKYIILFFFMGIFFISYFAIITRIFKRAINIFPQLNKIKVNYTSLTFILIILVFICVLISIFEPNKKELFFADLIAPVFYLFNIFLISTHKRKSVFYIIVKYLAIVTLLFVLLKAVQEYANCKNYWGKKDNMSILYKDKVYSECDSLLTIGQTDQYIFMYNKPKDKILVFPISQLSDIEIKKHIDTK